MRQRRIRRPGHGARNRTAHRNLHVDHAAICCGHVWPVLGRAKQREHPPVVGETCGKNRFHASVASPLERGFKEPAAYAPALPFIGDSDAQLETRATYINEAQVADELPFGPYGDEPFLMHVIERAERLRSSLARPGTGAQEPGATAVSGQRTVEGSQRICV